MKKILGSEGVTAGASAAAVFFSSASAAAAVRGFSGVKVKAITLPCGSVSVASRPARISLMRSIEDRISVTASAVTGTSANRAGRPGRWRNPEEIAREFAGGVEWILWDGPSRGGEGSSPGSTVVSVEGDRLGLLREGEIPFRIVTNYLGKG